MNKSTKVKTCNNLQPDKRCWVTGHVAQCTAACPYRKAQAVRHDEQNPVHRVVVMLAHAAKVG